ncbi:MAG: endonuclease/exonuclease/phosphatase family protein [Gammaproteobacteria bacterium]|nr:endonuclease/exonuclease/phosphatase family protein [Gammaproteobacteria bacterium]
MEKIPLKILTYNIHKGFNFSNSRFILHQIKEMLFHVNPDIVFLQEIHGKHEKHESKILQWPKESQFEFLAEELWPHFAYGKNAIYKKGHHGNAILSKYPFSYWENIDVSLQKRASRSLLHGIIQLPHTGESLHVICVHLGLLRFERDKQIQTLCDRIQDAIPVNEPLLIAGDFNDWRSRVTSQLELTLGLAEVFKTLRGSYARSFPAWQPTLAVDRIYYRGVKPELCKRFNQYPWRNLSDHLPLYAEFTI